MSDFPPAPPPPPPPPPPPGGTRPFSVGEAIAYGWKAYWRNAGPLIVLALIIIAVNVVIRLIGGNVNGIAAGIILDLLGFVIGIILAMGLIRASLAVVEGRTPQVSMLLETEGFGFYLVGAILTGLGVFLGFVCCIVPGIILAIMWQFFGYVIVEQPTMTSTEAMRRSAEITKGYRWPLFGLGLLLLLINFVGALLLGVGLIFTYGITAVTIAWAYKTLSGQPVTPA